MTIGAYMEFICDNVILEAWKVASSQLTEFDVVVKCWLVVQQKCNCVI